MKPKGQPEGEGGSDEVRATLAAIAAQEAALAGKCPVQQAVGWLGFWNGFAKSQARALVKTHPDMAAILRRAAMLTDGCADRLHDSHDEEACRGEH